MSQFGNNKSTPWGRNNASNPNLVNQGNMQPQMINQGAIGNGTMSTISRMVQFQQQQAFQNVMGLQQQNLGLGLQQMANNAIGAANLNSQLTQSPICSQVGAVTYPNPRALNPTAFQTNMAVPPVQNNSSPGTKQRFFTGTVTKVHDNFGFIDEDVFFQSNACVKGSNPMVGDRVLVEASYNPSMPFKWNATRIQVLQTTGQTSRHSNSSNKNYGSHSNTYNAVPPPSETNSNFGRGNRTKQTTGRGRERSRERDRDDDETERKRRREERMREREKEEKKSPIRRRSRSPKSRRRSRIVPRYMVQIPKIALNLNDADVLEIHRRYNNLYIPSDFFFSHFRWVDVFPPDKPFTLNKPCSFHIMSKDVDPVEENDSILEPPDADYLFSAKVMLMSVPGMEELFQKCCAMTEDKDKRDRDSEDQDFVHPTRLVSFLVGIRGKNETMAIGGPWSPSVDGENPEKDPSVLIKTAIRTCKALTGIDLSSCTQWYRFVELYYRRSESTHKGKPVPARVETVVIYLPDIWSCLPTRLEWDGLQQIYRKQLERRLKVDLEPGDETATVDEKEEETSEDKLEPTHYSELDPKTMAVNDLRTELKARGVNSKGLKSQLVAKLTKALKVESEKAESEKKDDKEKDKDDNKEEEITGTEKKEKEKDDEKDRKSEASDRKLDEREKALLEKRHTLPDTPHLIVHPSKTAKSGKFDCTNMSLSLLLDYRPEDTKEHSFEVSLFAELFNEMLMRDFGFNIFRALYELPDRVKEKDDRKKKDDDKKNDRKDKRKEEDKDKKKRSDDKEEEESDKAKKEKDDKDEDTKSETKSSKKEDRNEETDEGEEGEEEEEEKKKSDRRKKERVKLFTKDRHLLLSFVYFDQSHCGYIFDKDIEDLLYTLGLNLSRAQVRKLVGKVITRDSLHYRKLTDKPREDDFIVIDDTETDLNLQELAVGNKKLLPVFFKEGTGEGKISDSSAKETPTSEDGMVMYRGALVDVSKLMLQLERSEKARLQTEAKMVDLKTENTRLSEKYGKSNSTIKHLNAEVKDYRENLKITDESLRSITAISKTYFSTLLEIKDKVDPIIRSALKDEEKKEKELKKEEKERDKKNEESKSRWEKDGKSDKSLKSEKSVKPEKSEKVEKSEKNKESDSVPKSREAEKTDVTDKKVPENKKEENIDLNVIEMKEVQIKIEKMDN